MENILSLEHVQTGFKRHKDVFYALSDVSFTMQRGETLGIVGESGSGKSVTALSIMGLLGKNGQVLSGHILFNGQDLIRASSREMQEIRGNKISMIFQEPMTALNPVLKISYQMREVIRLHLHKGTKEADEIARQMLEQVGIKNVSETLAGYPHTLSGGMRQRVMIAMALVCHPEILIADEPTTALDVTIQHQICELMKELRTQYGTAIMLITHDLGVVAEMCDRVIVMYAGQIVEEADVFSLFRNTLHPYTKALMRSIPYLDMSDGDRLEAIGGMVPANYPVMPGCRFANRCSLADERCRRECPSLVEKDGCHRVRCWKA